MTNARDYIAAFMRGEDFTPPAKGVFSDGQPDEAALQILGKELAVANSQVREKIVELLVDMGRSTEPLGHKGADVLRHPHIIALLVGPGLVKPDLGRGAAMDALRRFVTPAELARFGDAFTVTLSELPSEEAFLLVAKAKPQSAKSVVDRLAMLPQWKEVQAVKIARAALGAKDIEDEFLAAADAAKDGEVLAQALDSLSLIGTPRSLKAIAERLRTPLTIHMVGSFEKSVRLSVLEALQYNFPDQPILNTNNIITEADYTAVERFCTKTFGVTYTSPPPPFMTIRGYPIPLVE